MEWLLPIVAKVDNVAILVLIVVFIWREYRGMQERKDDRADRTALSLALDRNTDALTTLRVVVAAISGKPGV